MMRFQRFIITCCCLLVLQSLGSAFTIPQRSVPRLAVITKQQATPRSKLLLLWMSNKNDDVQPISNDNNDPISNSDNPISRAASKCLVFLWRGMTLPFPMLRISQKASSGANNSIQTSTTFSLRECLFAIVAYLSLGAVAYTRVFERWSLIDALYFSVVSFSTVGTYVYVIVVSFVVYIYVCMYVWVEHLYWMLDTDTHGMSQNNNLAKQQPLTLSLCHQVTAMCVLQTYRARSLLVSLD
jgi:hypothetical protein